MTILFDIKNKCIPRIIRCKKVRLFQLLTGKYKISKKFDVIIPYAAFHEPEPNQSAFLRQRSPS